MQEKFKDINGFEGLYQVSNLGNVKSLPRKVSPYLGGVDNLEWCTHQENMDHAKEKKLFKSPLKGRAKELHPCYGRKGAKHPNFGIKSFDNWVSKIVLDSETGIFYGCIREAAEAKSIKYSTLKGKLNGNDKNNTALILV